MGLHVIVVGGGIIGSSTAYYLTKRGAEVTLLEGKDIASGTSGSCDQAIMLQSKKPGPTLELAKESAKIYATLEEELQEDLEYKKAGGMIIIETLKEMEAIRVMVERQRNAGIDVQLISRKEAKERLPDLADHILGATWWEHDAEVNPLKVSFAMARAAKRNGAKIRTRAEVTDLIFSNGKVIGVEIGKEKLFADRVVLTQGVWTPFLLKKIGVDLPIIPRKGQILVSERMKPFIHCNVLGASYITNKLQANSAEAGNQHNVGLSLGQTKSGTLLIGGSREFVGYDVRTDSVLTKEIAKTAVRVFPILKDASIIRAFAGLRPYTPDGLPIIGELETFENLFIAAGHEGDGIALAPITGKLVSAEICGQTEELDISMFTPNRFFTHLVV